MVKMDIIDSIKNYKSIIIFQKLSKVVVGWRNDLEYKIEILKPSTDLKHVLRPVCQQHVICRLNGKIVACPQT
jgi:hypothetical protein